MIYKVFFKEYLYHWLTMQPIILLWQHCFSNRCSENHLVYISLIFFNELDQQDYPRPSNCHSIWKGSNMTWLRQSIWCISPKTFWSCESFLNTSGQEGNCHAHRLMFVIPGQWKCWADKSSASSIRNKLWLDVFFVDHSCGNPLPRITVISWEKTAVVIMN